MALPPSMHPPMACKRFGRYFIHNIMIIIPIVPPGCALNSVPAYWLNCSRYFTALFPDCQWRHVTDDLIVHPASCGISVSDESHVMHFPSSKCWCLLTCK
jgi:hypothetical protein